MVVVMGAYVAIRLPTELVDEMDKLVGKFGFRSRAEIAKEGIRRILTQYILEQQPIMEESIIERS